MELQPVHGGHLGILALTANHYHGAGEGDARTGAHHLLKGVALRLCGLGILTGFLTGELLGQSSVDQLGGYNLEISVADVVVRDSAHLRQLVHGEGGDVLPSCRCFLTRYGATLAHDQEIGILAGASVDASPEIIYQELHLGTLHGHPAGEGEAHARQWLVGRRFRNR